MVLYNGMASTSPWAALYFVALMTFGNYVLFNLLVAILVEGFQAEVSLTMLFFFCFFFLQLFTPASFLHCYTCHCFILELKEWNKRGFLFQMRCILRREAL